MNLLGAFGAGEGLTPSLAVGTEKDLGWRLQWFCDRIPCAGNWREGRGRHSYFPEQSLASAVSQAEL